MYFKHGQMKHKAVAKDGFRSRLEAYAAKRLEEEGVVFEYEPYSITLSPSFETKALSIEKKSKVLKVVPNKIRAITYTPDFVGLDWIIETKGVRTPDFNIKWKLLKRELKKKTYLYMPTNQREVDEVIYSVKHNHELYKRLLRKPTSVKLATRSNPKSKVLQVQTRKSGGG